MPISFLPKKGNSTEEEVEMEEVERQEVE